ncbi:MAG: type IX secretion system sortase PorU [Candidatus Kapabacteria bacterium]|nr:type IX secretion system sortase PorU [Candidatus Kapabacteria bacterium]MDW8012347.1 type IX secretion system sortase PorU [Bacteroidota bacterium]
MRYWPVWWCAILFSVGTNAGGQHPGVKVILSSTEELRFTYHPVQGVPKHGIPAFLSIQAAELRGRSSEDWVVPVVEFPITVPGPDALGGIEILRVESSRSQGLPPTVRELALRWGGSLLMGPVPERWAELVYGGVARDRHVGYVRLRCALPVPELGVTEVLRGIEVRVRFLPERAVPPPNWLGLRERLGIRWTLNDEVAHSWYASVAVPQGQRVVLQGWRELSSGTWLRVKVREEGVYRITAEQLRQLGIQIAPNDIPTLKLFGTGGEPLPEAVATALEEHVVEQPIVVRTTADGQLSEIIFYGAAPSGFRYRAGEFEHFVNPYTDANVYLLTWGGGPGLRATPLPPPAADSIYRPSSFTARLFREEELYNPFTLPSGQDWFGQIVDPSLPVVLTTPLPGLERSGKVRYRFVVVNRAAVLARFRVFERERMLWEGSLRATAGYTEAVATAPITVEIPAELLAREERSVLRFVYTPQSGSGFGHIDWVEIHYPRRFAAHNDVLEVFTEPQWEGVIEISIPGFSDREVWGFDVTDRRRPLLLQNLAHSSGTFVFRTSQERNRPRRFFLSARLLSPEIERTQVAGLRDRRRGVPLVIITHPALQQSAEEYRRYREATGLQGIVVTVDAIANEFAAGIADPTAVRNFLTFALTAWQPPPLFVLLWGDGHHDYKNVSTQQPNYVLTYQSHIPQTGSLDGQIVYNAILSYTTDDYYTWLVGEDPLPDIALGRIPITSDAEGRWMVDKIRSYEQRSAPGIWRTTITLVADDGPTSGGSDYTLHTGQSEDLSRQLPAFLIQRKLYLAEYPTENVPGGRRKPRVTQDLVASVNAGTILLNWIGHGNPRLWAHEQVLERETTIPLFRNADRLFFLTAATCDFARFDNPQVPSGAEAMVLSRSGGAIGVFAASRLVYPTPNAAIMSHFYRLLFQRQPDSSFAPLGLVHMATKLQQFDALNDRKYVLLADPTLRLLFPTGWLSVDSVNGRAVTDSLPPVAAWSQLRLSGRVLSPVGQPAEQFSGTLYLLLTDAPVSVAVPETFGGYTTIHSFTKLGGTLHQGIYAVKDGRWTASFVIPSELSFSELPGKLFVVAFSHDGTASAAGLFASLRFAGFQVPEERDTTGPRIRLYLDDPSFRPGDVVRTVPELVAEIWDESGIHTAATLGRRIEAWVDESPFAIDLTPLFQPMIERPGAGVVRKPLVGLVPGLHRVRVRAWDVYGNPSTAETVFRIPSQPGLEAADVFPNPATGFPVRFSFLYTGVEPQQAELLIADLQGRILHRQAFLALPTRRVEILWDGRTSEGTPVTTGTYVYGVRLRPPATGETVRIFHVIR